MSLLVGPTPLDYIRPVDAELVGISPAVDLHVSELLFCVSADGLKFSDAVDDVDCQGETIDLVLDRQFHGRVDVPALLVAADMKVRMIRPVVSEFMNQPRITMEVEDNWFVDGKETVEVAIR